MRKVFTRIDIHVAYLLYCIVLYSTLLHILLTTMFYSFGKSQSFNVAFKTRYMEYTSKCCSIVTSEGEFYIVSFVLLKFIE